MPAQKASCRLSKMGINSKYNLGSFEIVYLFMKGFPCYLDICLASNDHVTIQTVVLTGICLCSCVLSSWVQSLLLSSLCCTVML